MIQFENKIDTTAVLNDITARINWANKCMLVYKTVVDAIFPKWEGKRFTKRVTNDAVAALEKIGIRGWYKSIAGMNYVNVDDSHSNIQLLICYDSDLTVSREKFEKHNGYNDRSEMIGQLRKGQANLSDLVSRWNKTLADLQAINKEAEQYGLEYTFDIKTR